MSTFMQSEIFFFISSIGFVVLWILAAVFLFYLIRATNTFSRVMNKLEKGVNKIGEETKEMLEDLRDSAVFSFLLGKKKRHRKDEK